MTRIATDSAVGCGLRAVGAERRAAHEPQKPKADLIFTHGNIYTGVVDTASSLGAGKRAEALAVVGDQILAVGTRDEIMKLKGPETKIVDLDGRFVMPGFNDAHMHLASAGLEKMNVNLVGVKTLDEFRERVRVKCETAAPENGWLARAGTKLSGRSKSLPTRWDVDEVSGDHPVYFGRGGRAYRRWPTRALCNLASITVASRDPEAGRSTAMKPARPMAFCARRRKRLVQAVIPKPTHEKRRQAIELALADLASHGITSAQDYSQWEDFQIYEELEPRES